MNKQLCTYYNDRSKRCSVGYCKLHYVCADGSCKVGGKIYDKFKNREVANFEYKRNYKDF